MYEAQSQMLIFNHTSRQLNIQKYYSQDEKEGYWLGSMEYLPVGCDSGLMISLMSQKQYLGTPYPDYTAANDEDEREVS